METAWSSLPAPTATSSGLRSTVLTGVTCTSRSSGSRPLADGHYVTHLTAPKVAAVDTTDRGDAFNGALAAALAEDQPLSAPVIFANHVTTLSMTRAGTQSSLPDSATVGSLPRGEPGTPCGADRVIVIWVVARRVVSDAGLPAFPGLRGPLVALLARTQALGATPFSSADTPIRTKGGGRPRSAR